MTLRIVQISDTHLSGEKPFFVANFECAVRALASERPDLVINTGDIALDGAGDERDLAEARRLHRAIDAPLRFIPGNHDLGDSHEVPGSHEQFIDEVRREAYRRYFGAEWWSVDATAWRLIGLNAMLFGSGLAAETEQLDFLTRASESADARHIALFIHKPLFDQSDTETVVGGRFLPPPSRHKLWAALGACKPALVASGHVHQFRATTSGDMHCVWAPATACIIADTRQPRYGIKQVGFVVHDLHEDGCADSRYVRAAGMLDLDIADFPDAYGPMT